MFIILRKGRWLLEPLVATVFFALWIVAEVGRSGSAPWPLFPYIVAAMAASIGLARRLPVVAIALPGTVILLQLFEPSARFGSTSWPVYFAFFITCSIVSASATGHIRWLALPITAAYAVMVSVLMTVPALSDGYGWESWVGGRTYGNSVVDTFAIVAFIGVLVAAGSWFIGFGLRSSRLMRDIDMKFGATVDELHSAGIDLIVSRERDRIAQDVHDIMAHSLAVIIAQADGARFIGAQKPEAIGDSLERIAGSARSSLAEVRILIESLVDEPEGHSNPTLENLDDLLQRMRGAGLTLTIDRFGEAHVLTPGQELAVYRIVQESLTNALKHAGREPSARITMDWRGPGLALNISSVGTQREPHDQSDSSTRTTRGLYGMRERARLAGGWLTASVDDEDDGYLVTAFIPSTGIVDKAADAEPNAARTQEEAAAL